MSAPAGWSPVTRAFTRRPMCPTAVAPSSRSWPASGPGLQILFSTFWVPWAGRTSNRTRRRSSARRRSWPPACSHPRPEAHIQGGDLDKFAAGYLDRIAEQLYSSVLADVLDDAGYRHQFMRPAVRPLYPGAKVVGRAATMLAVEVSDVPPEPYQLLME